MPSNEPVRRNRRTVLKAIGTSAGVLVACVSAAGADGDDDPEDGWAWEAEGGDSAGPEEGWAWNSEDGNETDPEEGWAWNNGDDHVADSAERGVSMADGDDTDPDDGWAW